MPTETPTETATKTLKKLETNFNEAANGNGVGIVNFKKNYRGRLEQFPEFNQSVVRDTDPKDLNYIVATNPMFGGENFRLKTTTAEQGKIILEKGKDAQKVFGKMDLDNRLDFLNILKEKIGKYSEDIKLTITADMGKPVKITEGEITKGNAWFDYIAKKAEDKLEPTITVGDKTIQSRHSREGLGVVQVIGAFNYPYALTIPGIVSGLVAGNSVVASTPEKAPNWIFPFMQAAHEAVEEFTNKHKLNENDATALKEGLIQYSIGRDPTLSNLADLVHFVGSDKTGNKIKEERAGKPTILEMGGSNVVTVMNSAITDNEKATKIATEIWGGFAPATGQRCTAPRILCVQKGKAEGVADALKAICGQGPAIGNGGIGNPFSQGTKIGPLADANALEKMQAAVIEAKELGATIHGELKSHTEGLPAGGNWVNPIVIDWSTMKETPEKIQSMHNIIKREEIFAPLIHIIHPVRDLQQAINITNYLDDTHKLAGAIYTANDEDHRLYKKKTHITSLARNSAPKDVSPDLRHGHPDMYGIGDENHFVPYSKPRIAVAKEKETFVGAGL